MTVFNNQMAKIYKKDRKIREKNLFKSSILYYNVMVAKLKTFLRKEKG